MNGVKAAVKTFGIGLVQRSYRKEVKQAQPNAYKKTCKQARGKYDPFFKEHYQKNLKQNLQKAEDKKERRTTFINSL